MVGVLYINQLFIDQSYRFIIANTSDLQVVF